MLVQFVSHRPELINSNLRTSKHNNESLVVHTLKTTILADVLAILTLATSELVAALTSNTTSEFGVSDKMSRLIGPALKLAPGDCASENADMFKAEKHFYDFYFFLYSNFFKRLYSLTPSGN